MTPRGGEGALASPGWPTPPRHIRKFFFSHRRPLLGTAVAWQLLHAPMDTGGLCGPALEVGSAQQLSLSAQVFRPVCPAPTGVGGLGMSDTVGGCVSPPPPCPPWDRAFWGWVGWCQRRGKKNLAFLWLLGEWVGGWVAEVVGE